MGRMCHAYSDSPSGVGIVKGVTWPLANPNCSALSISCQKRVLILWAYRALIMSAEDVSKSNGKMKIQSLQGWSQEGADDDGV